MLKSLMFSYYGAAIFIALGFLVLLLFRKKQDNESNFEDNERQNINFRAVVSAIMLIGTGVLFIIFKLIGKF